jgi:universal stress protein A
MKPQSLEPPTVSTATASPDDAITFAPPVIHLKNILVPLDLSEMSLKSLQYAVAFASEFGATLTLVHVVEPPDYLSELPHPAPRGPEHCAAVEALLQDIRIARIPEDVQVNIVIRHNFVFDGILDAAREIHADLIITTTHGHTGLKHLMMGSTAENIVRRAPCPVLVVRELEHDFV